MRSMSARWVLPAFSALNRISLVPGANAASSARTTQRPLPEMCRVKLPLVSVAAKTFLPVRVLAAVMVTPGRTRVPAFTVPVMVPPAAVGALDAVCGTAFGEAGGAGACADANADNTNAAAIQSAEAVLFAVLFIDSVRDGNLLRSFRAAAVHASHARRTHSQVLGHEGAILQLALAHHTVTDFHIRQGDTLAALLQRSVLIEFDHLGLTVGTLDGELGVVNGFDLAGDPGLAEVGLHLLHLLELLGVHQSDEADFRDTVGALGTACGNRVADLEVFKREFATVPAEDASGGGRL